MLPAGTVNVFYTQDLGLEGVGPETDLTWTLSTGELPAGLTLGTVDGVISGTTASIGRFDFEISAALTNPPADCAFPPAFAAYSLVINDAEGMGGAGGMGGMAGAGGSGGMAGTDEMMSECAEAADCPGSNVPRCEATCDAGVCGVACDANPPADGPGCPGDTNDPNYCAIACAYFAACAISECAGLQPDGYAPLVEGCMERQCGQAGLICTQMQCGILIGLAQTVDAEFGMICTEGLPEE
jgi:hypothetical protein